MDVKNILIESLNSFEICFDLQLKKNNTKTKIPSLINSNILNKEDGSHS